MITSTEFIAYRKQLGLSQASLSFKLGLHPQTVSKLEQAKLRVTKRTELQLRQLLSTGSCGRRYKKKLKLAKPKQQAKALQAVLEAKLGSGSLAHKADGTLDLESVTSPSSPPHKENIIVNELAEIKLLLRQLTEKLDVALGRDGKSCYGEDMRAGEGKESL